MCLTIKKWSWREMRRKNLMVWVVPQSIFIQFLSFSYLFICFYTPKSNIFVFTIFFNYFDSPYFISQFIYFSPQTYLVSGQEKRIYDYIYTLLLPPKKYQDSAIYWLIATRWMVLLDYICLYVQNAVNLFNIILVDLRKEHFFCFSYQQKMLWIKIYKVLFS